MFGNAYWEMDVTVTSSNGNSITVNKKEIIHLHILFTACNNMGTSFFPSVKTINWRYFRP